jgi:hypothetical protein
MSMIDIDECDCDCHNGDWEVSHVMACCNTCPDCHRRVRASSWYWHKQNCSANEVPDDLFIDW